MQTISIMLELISMSMILLKYMYGMNNSGNLFADELTEWFIEAGFVQYQ